MRLATYIAMAVFALCFIITAHGHTSQIGELCAWFCAFLWAFIARCDDKDRS